MSIQRNFSRSIFKAISLAAVATAIVLTSGCATPTGAAFTAAEALPEGQAQVYLYRKSAVGAMGQSFSVLLDKQPMGELHNASFMRLTLAPGEHVVSVSPSAMSKTYDLKLTLAAKQTQYVEFEVPPVVLFNVFLLGSDISVRTAEQAVADLQGLKSVK